VRKPKYLAEGSFAVVYWLDAWYANEFDPDDHLPTPVASVGHVLIHNEQGIQLGQDVGNEKTTPRCVKFIPTFCVAKIQELVPR
jgi:hypothetical protein